MIPLIRIHHLPLSNNHLVTLAFMQNQSGLVMSFKIVHWWCWCWFNAAAMSWTSYIYSCHFQLWCQKLKLVLTYFRIYSQSKKVGSFDYIAQKKKLLKKEHYHQILSYILSGIKLLQSEGGLKWTFVDGQTFKLKFPLIYLYWRCIRTR